MDERQLKTLLNSVRKGRTEVSQAVSRLRTLPFEDLSFARVDHHRSLRQGIPEVILGEYKTPEETAGIARTMFRKSGKVLVTRAGEEHCALLEKLPGALVDYNPTARTIVLTKRRGRRRLRGNIVVLTAGTSDRPVAEEAAVTAEFLGSRTSTVHDVGVAGLHRLMDAQSAIEQARVVIVVAGMEGALPSVVGGLTNRPVVAVPTSVGYGTSFGGMTALFAMLNSCVPGLAVVNIDNGFGAACLAHRINTLASR